MRHAAAGLPGLCRSEAAVALSVVLHWPDAVLRSDGVVVAALSFIRKLSAIIVGVGLTALHLRWRTGGAFNTRFEPAE